MVFTILLGRKKYYIILEQVTIDHIAGVTP